MTVATGVGTVFRLERRLFHRHRQAQATHHGIQHMIMLVTQPAITDLQRNMAITQMIGGAHHQMHVVTAHGTDGFLRGPDFNQAPLLIQQAGTIPQDVPPG